MGDGHDARAPGDIAAELEAVGIAERPDIRGDEVGALGVEHVEPDRSQAGRKQVALLGEISAELSEVLIGQAESECHGPLERPTGDEGQVLAHDTDGGDEI